MCTAACTPSLNWREVAVGPMTAMLPCKPDRAQRNTTLASQALTLEMAGCEAGGALFAVSHVQVPGPEQAAPVVNAWRAATLANMGAADTATAQEPSNVAPRAGFAPVRATGRRPDGARVQAELAWVTAGSHVFHIAVYADKLTADMADTLFAQARLP